VESYTVAQGTALSIGVTLEDDAGLALTAANGYIPFTGAEPLACYLWAGADQAIACTPAVAWAVAADATVLITVSSTQTTALAPGIYALRATLTTGDVATFYECEVQVDPAPGAAAVLPVYTTYARVLELAPWVKQCFDPTVHLTGFLRERAAGRKYFDNLILRLDRGNSVGVVGGRSAAMQWRLSGGYRRSSLPGTLMIAYLAANNLIVTDQVDRINAWLAAAEIGRQQIGLNNAYAALGSACAEIASSEISCCTAQIDLNADGVGDIAVPLGAANHIFT
jgi:hypothetical protein